MKKILIKKIALAFFIDKKIIMVRSKKQKEVFYMLGGKIEKGESDIDALVREVKEEINCDIDKSSIKFLKEFEDIAHGKENTFLNLKLYKANIVGQPIASSEIAEINFFDSNTDKKHISEIGQRQIFPWLKENNYII